MVCMCMCGSVIMGPGLVPVTVTVTVTVAVTVVCKHFRCPWNLWQGMLLAIVPRHTG